MFIQVLFYTATPRAPMPQPRNELSLPQNWLCSLENYNDSQKEWQQEKETEQNHTEHSIADRGIADISVEQG